MSIRTGICKVCGKKKEEHSPMYINGDCVGRAYCGGDFTDSGLSSLQEHAEELYEACEKAMKRFNAYHFGSQSSQDRIDEINSVLQKIKQKSL